MKMDKTINLIFDFDGVILDSNKVKTQAFQKISAKFGKDKSQQLVNYHIKNGGISRYKKLEWFVKYILKSENEELIKKLIYDYGYEVESALEKCSFRTNLAELKKKLNGTFWSIASGGKQSEIIGFLEKKFLLKFFEKGVYGSPTPKMEIVKQIISSSQNTKFSKYILIGDSYYDYECAKENGIKFIFAYDWSDIKSPKSIFLNDKIPFIKGIECLDFDLINTI